MDICDGGKLIDHVDDNKFLDEESATKVMY